MNYVQLLRAWGSSEDRFEEVQGGSTPQEGADAANRFWITGEIWALVGPMVERLRSKLGLETERGDRKSSEAVLHRTRTDVPWSIPQAEFGAWDAGSSWLLRWNHSERPTALFHLMAERAECGDARRLMIDSTAAGAHQHTFVTGVQGAARRRPSGGRAAA